MKRLWLIVLVTILAVSSVSAYTGSADLAWSPPTTFVDGTTLIPAVDLQGYKLYCGSASGTYTTSTIISGGTTTTYKLTGMTTGTTYCAVTAITTVANGSLESGYSIEASKTITIPKSNGCTGFSMK